MSHKDSYQCIIVGGGIAGLQAAIQLGRYNHQVLVIDKGEGRSTLCKCYHNVLGWPDGVDGQTLRHLGRQHAEKYGVTFKEDEIVKVEKQGEKFKLQGTSLNCYESKCLLLATGIKDHIPLEIPNLKECLGISIYICPDCDGYEVTNKKVIVAGSGDPGANMALTLMYWTKELIYINSDGKKISESVQMNLAENGIPMIVDKVIGVETNGEGRFTAFLTGDGNKIKGERGFLAFGGNKVNTDLLKQLGIERLENLHIPTNPRTKETNVPNVWVAGDIGVHSELLTIAMGEGAQAAIWIHKRILEQRRDSIDKFFSNSFENTNENRGI
ncbi:NAD(P)/FAD-dependent oxidoreductase [Bacillus sp. AFS031507]|uniref:NAD(P)/FAD-dependent oxidoreductase n=1 Tax=Bacillus sp. AFS031507 TaxID=2033496 RepID=UPI000BFE742E|nr:NAD(P)/FAD-dependent oxidoreductase [Bacillus sp. AFS031507]PGY04057.1 pyridine nucleotide-disulfide oxidoreductase [Bacillus sp. AFS031507]